MPRIAIILLGLVLGWCCGMNVSAMPVNDVSCVQTGIESTSAVELLCEREYNSDLGLPQPVAVESVRSYTVRTMPCPERIGVKCGVPCGRGGTKVECLPEFTVNLLVAGSGHVDYYVYRLRRLLI